MTKSLEENIKDLKYADDWRERRLAAVRLGYFTEQAAVQALKAALNDPDDEVQHGAVVALGRLGDPSVIDEIYTARIMNAEDPKLRWAAIKALSRFDEPRVLEYIATKVHDEDWMVRNESISALEKKIESLVAEKSPDSAKALLRLLSVENRELHNKIVDGLCRVGSQIKDQLLDALESQSDSVRLGVIEAIGHLREERAVPGLIKALKDDDAEIRRNAVAALGEIRSHQALKDLIEMLCDNSPEVREAAKESISRYGKRAVKGLLTSLQYVKNRTHVQKTLETLGLIQAPESVKALIEHLGDSYYVNRKAAINALVPFGERIVDELMEYLAPVDVSIQPFLDILDRETNKHVIVRVVRALGELKKHVAVKTLKKMLEDCPPDIAHEVETALEKIGCAAWRRASILTVLGEMNIQKTLNVIIYYLDHSSDDVREEAVRALASLKNEQAIQPLLKVTQNDEMGYLRRDALRAASEIKPYDQQISRLALSLLQDPDHRVRSRAAKILGRHLLPESIVPLLKAMNDPYWSVRRDAENALLNLGKEIIPPLKEIIEDSTEDLKQAAILILTELRCEESDNFLKCMAESGLNDKKHFEH